MMRIIMLVGAAGLMAAQSGPILSPHVPFVATPPEVAEEMLSLAQVRPSDVVYDLGCGDGRIVILAARKFRAHAVGIDIDPERIREAEQNARAAGVTDRVHFLQADLFYADLREASVVTMFLLPSINEKLRPRLWRQLRPGARVVTHTFDIGDWKPQLRRDKGGFPIYVWTIPQTTTATGQVALEDGSSPPLATAIERLCGGRVIFEGYTDARGRFSIALPFGEKTVGCRVRAVLPGYRSDMAVLGTKIGLIRLERASAHDGTLISPTTQAAPCEAREAYEEGRELFEQGGGSAARDAFARAVEIDAHFAMAWFELGRLLESGGSIEGARTAYERAIAADPNYISPYLGLAQIANHQNNWHEVTRRMETVLRLDPENFPEAWLLHAVGSLTLGNLDAAEKSARQAIRLDVAHRFSRAEYVLGLVLAMKGDADSAREHFAHFLQLEPKAPDAADIRRRLKR